MEATLTGDIEVLDLQQWTSLSAVSLLPDCVIAWCFVYARSILGNTEVLDNNYPVNIPKPPIRFITDVTKWTYYVRLSSFLFRSYLCWTGVFVLFPPKRNTTTNRSKIMSDFSIHMCFWIIIYYVDVYSLLQKK